MFSWGDLSPLPPYAPNFIGTTYKKVTEHLWFTHEKGRINHRCLCLFKVWKMYINVCLSYLLQTFHQSRVSSSSQSRNPEVPVPQSPFQSTSARFFSWLPVVQCRNHLRHRWPTLTCQTWSHLEFKERKTSFRIFSNQDLNYHIKKYGNEIECILR